MLIAFEGPDNVGKSTSAARLSYNGQPIYNATKANHKEAQRDLSTTTVPRGLEPDLVQTFDRIDWFSHLVYRLALPGAEWADERPRTVFAMPDTHLVVKIHRSDLADFTADEVVDTPIGEVNPMYYYFADFFTGLNRARGYALFKTVSLMEVTNLGEGEYSQRLVAFDSPVTEFGPGSYPGVFGRLVESDEDLLAWLQADEHARI